ncbi:MAG: hypothetical protein KA319_05400 [Ferruginibacter sp.]|nr:hypothetical protein [Ferruginibacter sp.]
MRENSSTTAHIAKNITIGVISSVLAAALIYFFLNNPVKEERKKKKEATVRAWKSYQQNRKIFSDVMTNMKHNDDIERSKSNISHEIDATITNMLNIKNESNIDQRLLSSIDITVDQMKEIKSVLLKYYDDMVLYIENNPNLSETQVVKYILEDAAPKLQNQMIDLKQRDSLRLTTIKTDLVNEYNLKEE